ISIAAGLVVLLPSLVLLYRLVLRGRLDARAAIVTEQPRPRASAMPRPLAAVALALLGVGAALTLFTDGAALAIGVIALAGFVVVGSIELLRPQALDPGERAR